MSTRTTRSRARHGARKPSRGFLVGFLSTVTAVAGFGLVFGSAYWANTQNAIDRYDVAELASGTEGTVEEAYVPTDFAADQAVNIVLIGTDERNDENADIGGDVADGMRGDTTMVLHVSADRERIDVVSIPRDSRVQISDCQLYDGSTVKGWTAKFNVALANGGINGDRGEAAACVMRTINDLTGVDTNGHFVMVDFAGFEDMVDAMDGVPMCIEQDMSSPKANLELAAGPQVLDGETALAFARARTGTGLGGDGSDLSRIDRQQELLTNLATKTLNSNVLTDLPKLTQLLKAGAESVSMDAQLGKIDNLVGFANSLRSFDAANLNFVTVPWRYAGDGSGDVLWDEPAATEMWEQLANDEPLTVVTGVEPSASPSPSTGTGDTMADDPQAQSSDTAHEVSNVVTAATPSPALTPVSATETESMVTDSAEMSGLNTDADSEILADCMVAIQ
ncbi:LCP family protein [Demequina flava]|uniref:LCP family protein n=1 Tax=Demequina flava TaxID=1095025 RepID=UPI0007818A27|nr:LCP family protein [Demequina flava]